MALAQSTETTTTTTASDASSVVPAYMHLSESLKAHAAALHKAPLIPLSFIQNEITQEISVKELTDQTTNLQQLLQLPEMAGSIVFAVRRPGWFLCREHGQQLSQLVRSANNDESKNWNILGLVKETGVDDAGLVEFYEDYFTFPLYKDADLQSYQALGNTWIRLLPSWNPLTIYQNFRAMKERTDAANVTGNLKGEGLVQGGILLYNAQGELHYAYKEDTGQALQMDDIQAAMKAIVMMKQQQQQENESTSPKQEL